jgi:hypothetical protein
MAEQEQRVVLRCRPYASFAQPLATPHSHDQPDQLLTLGLRRDAVGRPGHRGRRGHQGIGMKPGNLAGRHRCSCPGAGAACCDRRRCRRRSVMRTTHVGRSAPSRTTHDDVSIGCRSVRCQVWFGKGILSRL